MWKLLLATSLLGGQVLAGVIGEGRLLNARGGTEARMRRCADSTVAPLERRQSSNYATNNATWDAQTLAACTEALGAMSREANNPSGMAACYNLPYLDNSTGVFQADLRLFTVSPPTGEFAGIPSQDVQVDLSYVGATVSPITASTLKRRGGARYLISWFQGAEGKLKRQVANPTVIQSYAFVGQINKDLLSPDMDATTLNTLLAPTVTLMGKTASGAVVNTSLSNSEATYVSGIFAESVTTTLPKADTQPPIQTLVVAPGEKFVLPGSQILIPPIGLVITLTWSILFIATVAFGTIGRMQFRDQYRAARDKKPFVGARI